MLHGLVSSLDCFSAEVLIVWPVGSLERRDGYNSFPEGLPLWELVTVCNLLDLLTWPARALSVLRRLLGGGASPFKQEASSKLWYQLARGPNDSLRVLNSLVANTFATQCWTWQVLNHMGKRHFCLLLHKGAQRQISWWIEKARWIPLNPSAQTRISTKLYTLHDALGKKEPVHWVITV